MQRRMWAKSGSLAERLFMTATTAWLSQKQVTMVGVPLGVPKGAPQLHDPEASEVSVASDLLKGTCIKPVPGAGKDDLSLNVCTRNQIQGYHKI